MLLQWSRTSKVSPSNMSRRCVSLATISSHSTKHFLLVLSYTNSCSYFYRMRDDATAKENTRIIPPRRKARVITAEEDDLDL